MPFLPKVRPRSEPHGSKLQEQRDVTTPALLQATPPTVVGASPIAMATLPMLATLAWSSPSAFHPPPFHDLFASLLAAPALAQQPMVCLTTAAVIAAAPGVVSPRSEPPSPLLAQAAMQTVFGNSSLSRRDEHRALVSQFLPRPPTRRDVADDHSILAYLCAHQGVVAPRREHASPATQPPSGVARVNGKGEGRETNALLDSLGLWPRRH
jgi:hypothetical protein